MTEPTPKPDSQELAPPAKPAEEPTIDVLGSVARFAENIPARLNQGWDLLRRWFSAAFRGDTVGLASQISFEMLFLLAPGLLFLSATLGFFGTDPSTLRAIVELLKGFLPSSLHPIIDQQVAGIILTGSSGKIFVLGILLALYLGMVFISTVTHALNKGHGIHSSKGWMGRQVIALLLMFWFALTVLFSFNVLVFGERLAAAIETTFKLEIQLESWVALFKIPVVVAALTVLALALYLVTPDVYQKVGEALPGALFFSIGWFLATHLFRLYVEGFAHYSELYLALASFIILMLWTWVTSFLLLLGGKLNAVLQEMREKTPEPPLELPATTV